MTLCEVMFRRAIARQSRFFDRLSEVEKKKLAEVGNKYAELRITGHEGGLFYFEYLGQRLKMLEGKPSVPSGKIDKLLLDGDMINYPSGDEVFFDVIDGELSPRAVISHKYFRANTDRIIYDTEEFAQAFEQFLEEMRTILRVKR